MKVRAASEALRFTPTVREKDSPEGQERREQKHPQKDSKDGKGSREQSGFSLAEVEKAVNEFDAAKQAQGHGLVASTEGNGPGLRVVLRDGRGAVVRQFTGEEFVRLREAAVDGDPTRGRLLDKKL